MSSFPQSHRILFTRGFIPFPLKHRRELQRMICVVVVQGNECVASDSALLSACDRTLPWNLGFEITQPRPERPLVQVHFGDADRAPFPGLGEDTSILASWPKMAVSIQLRETSS